MMLYTIYRYLWVGLILTTIVAPPLKAEKEYTILVLSSMEKDTIPESEEDIYLKQLMEEKKREREERMRNKEELILKKIIEEIEYKKKIKSQTHRNISLTSTETHSETLEKEYRALMKLYEATNGDGCIEEWCYPNGWLIKEGWEDADSSMVQPVTNDWTGITVDENGYVVSIILPGNGLYGHIPKEIGDLEHLNILDLGNMYGNVGPNPNRLIGSIPHELSYLSNLSYLHLGNIGNSHQIGLTDSIPSSLGQLSNLQVLYLSNNNLTGNIPESLSQLSNLQELDLGINQLTDSIPSSLGQLSNLQVLDLSFNDLTGSIPSSFGQLSNLQVLNLGINIGLTGNIPESLSQLIDLQELYLGFNQLTDSIPSSLGQLSNLQELGIYNTQLTGDIPESLSQLSNLQLLSLHSNQLTGKIPSSLGQLSNLRRLDLYDNKLTDSIPSSLGQLSNLRTLNLNTNQLTGKIPSNLGQLSNLTSLNLHTNELIGKIPDNLSQISYLTDMAIQNNKFTFSDILNIVQNFPGYINNINFSDLYYAPQAKVGQVDTVYRKIGGGAMINATVDNNTDPPSTFTWYKNNVLLQNQNGITINGPTLTIDTMSAAHEGVYTYKITNSAASDLTLGSEPITLLVCEEDCALIIPQSEYEALIDLYKYAGGENWTNQTGWANADPNGDPDVNGWHGVTVENGYVTSINLANNNLSGSLPASLANFPNLNYLSVENNNLSFNDILQLVESYEGDSLTYSPQALVGEEEFVKKEVGSQVVIITNIDQNTSTSSVYTWYKNGVLLQSQSGITIDGPTLIIDNMSVAHEGVYTYTITNSAAPDLTLTSHPITLQLCEENCGPSATISATQTPCGVVFNNVLDNEQSCNIKSFEWNFGDGETSIAPNPLHDYAQNGQYAVTLRVKYDCGDGEFIETAIDTIDVDGVEDTPFTNVSVTVPTNAIQNVLSSSVATFSDTWPLAHPDESIAERHGYTNGTQGVWRSEGNWVYDVERAASENVNVAEDGTFTLERFNHQYADLEAVPHWMKVNTVTTYSPYSYELENQDILGRYTSALYSYGGQLPQATGANMRQQEMAFTSFEYMEGSTDGNWMLGSQAKPAYQSYKVRAARGRLALVEASLDELQSATDVDVHSYKLFSPSRRVQQNTILCRYEHEDNPEWSVVVFERPVVETLWRGAVIVRGTYAPAVNLTLDTTWAHAGQKSMKVNSNITLKQPILQLDSTKQYLLSAWVSEKNLQAMMPELSEGISIDVVFKNESDVEIARTSISPNGSIIEGWQRLEGLFALPIRNPKMELVFKNGNAANVWFDDLKLHPVEGNMQAYVYNLDDYRLQAVLDENHYASFYYYDAEGNLYLTKKETLDGIKTISETISHTVEVNNP